jgi:hypothetical protein
MMLHTYLPTTAEVDELRSANQKLRSREQSFLTEKGLQAHKISELDEQLVQFKQVTLGIFLPLSLLLLLMLLLSLQLR